MAVDIDKVAQEAIDAISEKIKNLNTLNIIVAGKTGVGKSTLINAVFRDKLAETGMGKPVTDHMRKISKKGIPLAIYDTKGFELGKLLLTGYSAVPSMRNRHTTAVPVYSIPVKMFLTGWFRRLLRNA